VSEPVTFARKCVAEVVGTFILVFFGVGSVHAAVLTGAQQGIWQVAIVWGVAIPSPHGGFFTACILSPLIGAVLGSTVYQGTSAQGTVHETAKRWGKTPTETQWEKIDDNPARG